MNTIKLPPEPWSEIKRKDAALVEEVIEGRLGEVPPLVAKVLKNVLQRLSSEAHSAARKERIESQAVPVLDLPKNATNAELAAGRRKQAVRRGDEVFLPICPDDYICMPLCFLRSSLFPAATSSATEGTVSEKNVPVLNSDISIRLSGPELRSGDRRVLAACLAHYRNRPLAAGENGCWVETSLHELGRNIGLSIGRTTASAIEESLGRLSQVKLLIREKGKNYDFSSLVEVSRLDPAEKGTKIKIRIQQNLAQLYGKGRWWKIPISVLSFSKLMGWLACFFASHSKHCWLSTRKLHELSGLNCKLTDFEGRLLGSALEALSDDRVHRAARVFKVDKTRDPQEEGVEREPNRRKTGQRIRVITVQMHEAASKKDV